MFFNVSESTIVNILRLYHMIQPYNLYLTSFHLQVTNSGLVTWTPAQRWETFCRAIMTLFPFDTQNCEIQIINFVNQMGSNVNLQLTSSKVSRYSLGLVLYFLKFITKE